MSLRRVRAVKAMRARGARSRVQRAALLLALLLVPAHAPGGEDVRALSHVASHGLTGSQVADAHDARRLHARGIEGEGVQVAILTWGSPSSASLDAFSRANGIPPTRIARHGDCSGGEADEWDLDAQAVHLMAPRAVIHAYCAPSATFSALLAALENAIADDVDIISISWGTCEPRVPDATARAYGGAFRNASARSIAVFAASGDGGSRECSRASVGDQRLATSWPAVDPLVVSVGGTRLDMVDGGWRETAWATCAPCEQEWSASGGGLSAREAAPHWQDRVMRAAPDVAALADRDTGLQVHAGGRVVAMGGTSLSAPLWAGAWALVVGEAGRQGRPGPLLWRDAAAFDVTSGSNGDHSGTPGHDLVTGWGSLRAGALFDRWAAGTAPPSGLVAVAGPGAGDITLTWEARAGETGIVLGGAWGAETPLAASSSGKWVDTGLAPGTTRSYRVASPDGPESASVLARAFDVPGAPRLVRAIPLAAATRVDWLAPETDGGAPLRRYHVDRWVAGEGARAGTVVAAETSFLDAGCPRLALCEYTVTAENVAGAGPPSARAITVDGVPDRQ